jgi:hypothetical protein
VAMAVTKEMVALFDTAFPVEGESKPFFYFRLSCIPLQTIHFLWSNV